MTASWKGKKILITAGPTYEPIDPVRFIGNRSSGKMGYALAEAFSDKGAEVIFIHGPLAFPVSLSNARTISIETAEEMYLETVKYFPECQVAVLAAAVADYTPAEYHSEKIKKGDDSFILKLRKTKDILATLGKMKQNWQILVGFSLETENEIENSRKKLIEKNCDMIVLNSLKDKGAGFGTDTNQITILERNGTIIPFTLKSKKEVAFDILARIETML